MVRTTWEPEPDRFGPNQWSSSGFSKIPSRTGPNQTLPSLDEQKVSTSWQPLLPPFLHLMGTYIHPHIHPSRAPNHPSGSLKRAVCNYTHEIKLQQLNFKFLGSTLIPSGMQANWTTPSPQTYLSPPLPCPLHQNTSPPVCCQLKWSPGSLVYGGEPKRYLDVFLLFDLSDTNVCNRSTSCQQSRWKAIWHLPGSWFFFVCSRQMLLTRSRWLTQWVSCSCCSWFWLDLSS